WHSREQPYSPWPAIKANHTRARFSHERSTVGAPALWREIGAHPRRPSSASHPERVLPSRNRTCGFIYAEIKPPADVQSVTMRGAPAADSTRQRTGLSCSSKKEFVQDSLNYRAADTGTVAGRSVARNAPAK